jgi:hypothetical protein
MIKHLKLTFTAISLITLFSCDNDDATGHSTTPATKNVNGVITTPSNTTINVMEEDKGEYTYSVTLDKPQVVDIYVHVKQISGSATFGEDYEASDIVIPAYATSASGTLKIKDDCTVEGVENFTLQIGDIKTSNATIPSKTISFTIGNNLSNNLDLAFHFDKDFTISGEDFSLCGIGYDIDYYLLDSDYNDTGIYDAATGNCTERLTLTNGDLADGTYYIYYDIYETGNINGGTNTSTDGINAVYHDPMEIVTTVDYERCGGIDHATFTQEEDFVPSSTQATGSDYVITVKLENGKFTLENSESIVLASGKMASIKDAVAKARLNNPNKK